MHDIAIPHCSYCSHFVSCFQIDLVIEWGYCSLKKNPPQKELDNFKIKVELGDYQTLSSQSQDLGLFIPCKTDCKQFMDLYPF
jgi:hypothetical protein